MNYKDVLIRLASMTLPYVYDDTISFLELDRRLYKIVHELIGAMQGLNKDYEQFKTDMTNSFNEFTTTINNNFDEFKSDVNNQISTFEENITTNFNNFKTEIENNFNTLEGEFNTLKTYVDNYFENLNLDEEVQAVIQKMYSDGTLADIINEQVFTELNNKVDTLIEKVDNMNVVTTISEVLIYQQVGNTSRYYSNAFNNPKDNQLYVVTFPNEGNNYTDIEVYYTSWSGSGMGWKITNVANDNDIKGQTVLLQAHVSNSTTFTVVSILPNAEFIKGKINDLLITTCGNGVLDTVGLGESYYVYNEKLKNPTDNQLYIITMPELTNNSYTLKLYYTYQSGGYNGWDITNVSPIDVSEQTILVQAHVNGGTITFTNVGIIPNRELITNKINDLLITTCGNSGLDTIGISYYVYNEKLKNPTDNQLYIITMPELTNNSYTLKLYYTYQSGAYNGWDITNVSPRDVSEQTILVQAHVNGGTITFDVIGVISPTYDFTLQTTDSLTINATNGTVTEIIGKGKKIGGNQALIMGSFMIVNRTGSNSITIQPPLNWGSGLFNEGDKLYLQEISSTDNVIDMNTIILTYSKSNNYFTGNTNTMPGNSVFLIMPQFFQVGVN